MKGAILLCDHVQEKYISKYGDYIDMIQRMFGYADCTIDFDQFDCRASEFPTRLDDYDFFITTGSKHSVYDGFPWIDDTIRFIQTLNEHNKKLIGICFGHQLIAKAFGIGVSKSERGWGLGVSTYHIINSAPFMEGAPESINTIVSHQDQIEAIPIDANLIATNDHCPYFMVQWNDHFLSVQGHPEWVVEYSRVRISDREAILDDATFEAANNSLTKEPDNTLLAEWFVRFIK